MCIWLYMPWESDSSDLSLWVYARSLASEWWGRIIWSPGTSWEQSRIMDSLRDGWNKVKLVKRIRWTTARMKEQEDGPIWGRDRFNWSTEDRVKEGGQALCSSLGLVVYGNGSKHDIFTAASGTTSASNDSPATQWVVKLQPPELSPSPTTTICQQPGALVLTRSPEEGREEGFSSQQLTELNLQNRIWPF